MSTEDARTAGAPVCRRCGDFLSPASPPDQNICSTCQQLPDSQGPETRSWGTAILALLVFIFSAPLAFIAFVSSFVMVISYLIGSQEEAFGVTPGEQFQGIAVATALFLIFSLLAWVGLRSFTLALKKRPPANRSSR